MAQSPPADLLLEEFRFEQERLAIALEMPPGAERRARLGAIRCKLLTLVAQVERIE